MNKTRNILRLIFLLVAIALLVYLNGKSNDNTQTVAEFKLKTYHEIKKDSLDSREKLDLLVNGTETFVDGSSRVRSGIRYLTLLFGLLVVVELTFLILNKRAKQID